MKVKSQNITYVITCVFLLCYFLRIFNMPNEVTLILGSALCMSMVIQQKKIRIDIGICLLAVALVSYYVIVNGIKGLSFSILYIPLMIYELGNYVICRFDEDVKIEHKALLLLFIMIAGYSIHGVLNSYMWYEGHVVPGTRRWMDFWSYEIVPGTQHIAYFLPAVSIFLPGIIYFKERKGLNLLFSLVTLFFVYTSLVTKSRMSIVIFAMICFAQLITFIILEGEQFKRLIKNKLFWISGIIGVLVAVVGLIMIKDSEVVTAFVENMNKGGGILNNVRFKAQKMALQQLFLYPMGGNLMDLGGISHSHNTWLDMANAAGLIPFAFFTVYTLYTLYQLVKLMASTYISTKAKMILLGIFGSFFLYMSVEPVLEASIHLMTPWIFTNGLIRGWNASKRNHVA